MTIPDDLEQALDEYQRNLEVQPALSAVMQAALREYLRQRGYLESDEAANGDSQSRSWPRYPLYSGDAELAENDEETLAGAPDRPAFGER